MRDKIFICLVFVLVAWTTPAQANHAVNINTADKATLMTLVGIGEVKARLLSTTERRTDFLPT